MLYRLVVSFIWIFWVVMAVLLIRSEYFPEHNSLYRLPVEFVAQKVFRSDTGSDLVIYYKQAVVGKILIEPAPLSQNVLKGSAKLDWPVLGRNYRSENYFTLIFDSKLQVQQFHLSSRGDDTVIQVEANRDQNKVQAAVRLGEATSTHRFKWTDLEDQNLDAISAELKSLGSPNLPAGLLLETTQQIRWYASATSLRSGDRTIETFLIASEGNRDYWVKIWVTPSGEIVLLESSPGVGLRLENPAILEP